MGYSIANFCLRSLFYWVLINFIICLHFFFIFYVYVEKKSKNTRILIIIFFLNV